MPVKKTTPFSDKVVNMLLNRLLKIMIIVFSVNLLAGCGYNEIQSQDEQVKAAWSEVINQYQRRADLVPNLVNTVKGYAHHEQAVLENVTAARASVGSIKLSDDVLNDPQALERFQQAQQQLSSALSRLLVVSENYPQLQANELYRDLLVQLEGTENRITVARGRYVRAVQQYNTLVRQFPQVVVAKMLGYHPKANFNVENQQAISTAPKVEFN